MPSAVTGHKGYILSLLIPPLPLQSPSALWSNAPAPLPALCPPAPQVAMLGTSSALWAPLAQVLRGTLIFNFLSKPLAGESSTWHGGTADALCDGGPGDRLPRARRVQMGHSALHCVPQLRSPVPEAGRGAAAADVGLPAGMKSREAAMLPRWRRSPRTTGCQRWVGR